MRPSSAPIFFSHPFDSYIQGCRNGDWKFLVDETGEMLYDLRNDPDEENNVVQDHIHLAQALKKSTRDHFSNINALYENRAFAPDRKKGLLELGSHVLQLDFSNSLRIDDARLEEIARACPNLAKLSLAHCLLLTDKGLCSLFKFCPLLEELNIEGLRDVTGEGWGQAVHLSELKALDCFQFREWRWLKMLPSLRRLSLESEFIDDEALISMAESLHDLRALNLRGLTQMKDRGLITLCEANPYLTTILIHDCPDISDESVLVIQKSFSRLILIERCPQVSIKTIGEMAGIYKFSGSV